MTELLAPAGSRQQLTAAVLCGADAVYMGTRNFNARRNAENFDGISLKDAVSFCHARDVKVYVTLNTLIKDEEICELESTIREVAEAGADAVLVQDLAVYDLIRHCVPTMPLHASTQMAVHNAEGAKMLERMGFSRIVLARELSFDEIRDICRSVSCEIEVFVHGAHCMSASGLCYMSSALGGRSGNRGLCAQPCRLNFRRNNREYALSLKDMCLIDELDKLVKCGVSSLKIEGRMKRPEYVAAVVTEYRKALSGLTPDIQTLKNVFSRSGFTKGYFNGKRTLEMFGFRTKEDVENMNNVLRGLENLYVSEKGRIAVDLSLTLNEDRPAVLTAGDGKNCVTVTGDVPQQAIKKPLDRETADRYLKKTGGTCFYVNSTQLTVNGNLTLTGAAVNSLRRSALDELYKKRCVIRPHEYIPYECHTAAPYTPAPPEIRCRFSAASQIFDGNFSGIILPLDETDENIICKFGEKLICELPVLIYGNNCERVKDKLLSLKKAGLRYAAADNIGGVKMITDCGLGCIGSAGLNILNSRACEAYAGLGVEEITVSREISFPELRNISSPVPLGVTVYGYMPLMHFRCCPMQSTNGCGDCDGKQKLTDRLGKEFPVLCASRKYSVLHNCVTLYVPLNDIPDVAYCELYFTTESRKECQNIYETFVSEKSIDGPRTMGLYNKKLL